MNEEKKQMEQNKPEEPKCLWIQESAVEIQDGDKRYGLGESDVYETHFTKVGDLYRSRLKEHGRCTGKVYHDNPDGTAKHIGWCFIKRKEYEDDRSKTWLCETWVTVHTGPPTKTITYHQADL